ncbi:zinc finger X-linked protein ZXDB [Drosophila albomicans]|uniref:Zinc finger X-linked protein ZXDB n=1 Tax=Drosophila albomicans TaxID=7291 RepID=A0A9C6SZ59_DROAB|nr:zinc finger X-linked protein ZXDB [Drosophila albomicans]
MNKRVATTTMVTTQRLLGLQLLMLLLLCLSGSIASAQQLLIARPQRSIYGAPPLGPSGPPTSLGWNSVGSFSPLSFGHMTKDELLTLLEAWQEVEEESAPPPTPAPEPVEKPAPPPPPKRPIRPPPRPRPTAPPAAGGGGGGGGGGAAVPPPGTPVTVRLPAFVPIQLSAMYTPPLAVIGGGGGGGGGAAAAAAAAAAGGGGGGGGGNGGAAAAAAAAAAGGGGGGGGGGGAGGGAGAALTFDSDFPDIDDEDAAQPRLFRYMQLPMTMARPQPQPQPHPRAAAPPSSSHVMRNTLESVDAGLAPLSNFVNVKSKTANFRPPMSLPIKPPTPSTFQGPVIRPRFLVPPSLPYLANAPGPLELVPSSQIIGDWRE